MSKMYEIVVIPDRLLSRVSEQGETKMGGFQSGYVELFSGIKLNVTVENFKYIYYVQDFEGVPFGPEEIKDIIITHLPLQNRDEYNARDREISEKGYFGSGIWPKKSVPKF